MDITPPSPPTLKTSALENLLNSVSPTWGGAGWGICKTRKWELGVLTLFCHLFYYPPFSSLPFHPPPPFLPTSPSPPPPLLPFHLCFSYFTIPSLLFSCPFLSQSPSFLRLTPPPPPMRPLSFPTPFSPLSFLPHTFVPLSTLRKRKSSSTNSPPSLDLFVSSQAEGDFFRVWE